MSAGKPEEFYILGRDEEESLRLNQQHIFLSELTENNLIHASIPKDRVLNVADVATGTGIWLKDISELLKGAVARSSRYYHGFDISPAQFPSSPSNLDFSVQDILKPFPLEHVGRYDLVHVRLLVGALKEVDYKTALENLTSLLRPGGYLQWEECGSRTFSVENADDGSVLQEIRRVVDHAMDHIGLSLNPPDTVYRESFAAGLKNVTIETYNTASRKHHRQAAQKWLAEVFRRIIPPLMLRSGQAVSEDVASQKTNDLIDKFTIEFASGAAPAIDFKMVVAQKA